MQNRPPKTTPHVIIKMDRTKSIIQMKKHYIMCAVSVGHGLNDHGKKQTPEEELHVQLMLTVGNHFPHHYMILAGGSLQRWNVWDMIKELSDEELAQRLLALTPAWLTTEAAEKKISREEATVCFFANAFSDIAEHHEKNYIDRIEKHFDEVKLEDNRQLEKIEQKDSGQVKQYLLKKHVQTNKGEAKTMPIMPVSVLGWKTGFSFENYDKNLSTPITDEKDFEEKLKLTKERLLKNKKPLLASTMERLIKANPLIGEMAVDDIAHYAIKHYLLEEYHYFEHLKQTEVLYPIASPPLLQRIFDTRTDLIWRSYSITEKEKKIEEKPSKSTTKKMLPTLLQDASSLLNDNEHLSLRRSQSASMVDSLARIKDNRTRRQQLAPLKTRNDNKLNSLSDKKNEPGLFCIQTNLKLSPNSEKCFFDFFGLASHAAPEDREIAMKKISEAIEKETAILQRKKNLS